MVAKKTVKKTVKTVQPDEQPQVANVKVYRDHHGEYRWKAVAYNNEIVADSGEGYVHAIDCFDAARSLFPDAPVD